jgi:hypothetical protein
LSQQRNYTFIGYVGQWQGEEGGEVKQREAERGRARHIDILAGEGGSGYTVKKIRDFPVPIRDFFTVYVTVAVSCQKFRLGN